MSPRPETLSAILAAHAARDPQRCLVRFVEEDGTRRDITLGELHDQALGYAAALRALGVAPGDVVILVLRHAPAVLDAFFGAMYLGAVPAIFSYLTEKLDPAVYAEQVRALVAQSAARAVITFPEFTTTLVRLLAAVDCRVVSTADVRPHPHATDGVDIAAQVPDRLALVQYTSGTTGLHKGVAHSHRAILQFVDAYFAAFPMTREDVVVSWLPLYHDMGLLAGLLMPLVAGATTVLMSPFYWVREPVTLLRAIHELQGTLCWMPNFAFNHCVRSIRERDLAGIDLRHWRAVFCGGEPVRWDALERFAARFAPYGFRRRALLAGYGMAESVMAATLVRAPGPPRVDWIDAHALEVDRRAVPMAPNAPGATSVVSNGPPLPGTTVAIIDAEGTPLAQRQVGEITLSSPCLLPAYYRRPDLPARHDGVLRTGDIGYLADGELYVCGRQKDLIIVGGRNLHPEDLEAIAEGVPGIRPGRAVAFGIVDERLGTERVVMVCELRDPPSAAPVRQIDRALRRAVLQRVDVALGDLRLVDRGWVLKTSNGKMARAANRQKYLATFARTAAAATAPGTASGHDAHTQPR